MRCLILGFACGVGLLQLQPALPTRHLQFACAAALILCAIAALLLSRWKPGRAGSNFVGRGVRWTLAFACGVAAGFLYASVTAERRMADELPARFEGVDIAIAGIVSGLPTLNQSDRSVRFAFDVER